MLTLSINGALHNVDLDPDSEHDRDKPLLWVLRDDLKMTGSKYGCGRALCGACTVLVDGQPVRACVLPATSAVGRKITTIEGIGDSNFGRRVQRVWRELNVPQCGYCQSGQIMAVVALLRHIPRPSDREIDEAMSGNICRCGMYPRIRKAIHQLAEGEL